eukprot:gene820-biopygen1611
MIASREDPRVTEQLYGSEIDEEEERLNVENEEDADANMADAGEDLEEVEAAGKQIWQRLWQAKYRSAEPAVSYTPFVRLSAELADRKAKFLTLREKWRSLRTAAGASLERRLKAKLAFKEEQLGRVQAESQGHALNARLAYRKLADREAEVEQLRQDVADHKAIIEGYEQDSAHYIEDLAKANERVESLGRENATLVEEKAALQEKLESSEGKAQSHNSARVLAAALSKPPYFDGKGLLQTRGAQQVEDWVHQVQRYTGNLKLYAADAVSVAASLLRDEAARAWSATEVVMQANNETLTLDAVKKCLLSRFTPAATVFKTRKQLHSLQLGKGSCKSVPQYVQEFDRIAALIPDLGIAEKLHHFVEGIEKGSPDLVQRCCIDPTTSALFTDYSRLRAATLNAAVHTECLGVMSAAYANHKERIAKWDNNPASSKKPKL